MRKILILMFVINTSLSKGQEYINPAENDPGYLGESEKFMFFEHYWLNMHHWLYNMSAKAQKTTMEETFPEQIKEMSDSDAEKLSHALDYYKENILQYDLRTSGYTYHFKRWVITQPNDAFEEVPGDFLENVLTLKSLNDIYREYFWGLHHKENLAVFKENIELVKSIEIKAEERLVNLCQSRWQEEKIRVDICYHSKLERPYTTTGPVAHIVMDSNKNRFPEGNWAELLFHESAHHLMGFSSGFVAGTISNVSKVHQLPVPRQLAHSYLFYITGKVTEELLAESTPNYELYMVRNKVFSRRYDILNKYLPLYMNDKTSLADVTLEILKSLK